MREHLYKAKRADNQGWITGDYMQTHYNNHSGNNGIVTHKIYPRLSDVYPREIDPETLCRITGFLDKKGQNIWEGDIISDGDPMNTGAVEFDADCGWIFVNSHATLHVSQYCNHYSVIGNIFDDETA
jgi:hypothetical protein